MAAPPPVLTLAVEKGPREGDQRQCRAGAALRVGRVASGNDLAVRDVGASQRHLAIEFLPPPASRWAVSDLGSSNGTLLNGARLAPTVPAPLSHGDLISVGESTVLAVSIAPDSDPNPSGPRRSSRRAAAVVAVVEEEMPPVITRRSARKKAAAAEPPEAEKEGPDAVAVVVEEKPRVVTRRGGWKKAAAAEPPKPDKDEEATVVTRRGGRKKAAEPPEPEKEEEATMVTRRGGRKKAAEPPEPENEEEEEEAIVVPHRGGQKKASEPEKAEEEKEQEAAVATRRGGRKKDAATTAPPPLPPKTRGRGRVTRASARKPVHEEEEQEKNEVAASTELTGNPSNATAAKGGEEEKGDKVGAGNGQVEGSAKALEEEVPIARRGRARRAPKGRTNAQCAASDNGGEEEKGGGEEETDGKKEVVGSGGDLGDGEKAEEHAGRSSLATMTLREWFERMEKYLPRMIDEAADEMIATLQARHRRVDEYISTLRNSSDPS